MDCENPYTGTESQTSLHHAIVGDKNYQGPDQCSRMTFSKIRTNAVGKIRAD